MPTFPPTHLSRCFCPSQEVFSCNCLMEAGLCSLPPPLPGLLLMRTLSSQATKEMAVCGSGMLNMEGRGACDPNKFQILFPATSGSSCVQALRPFPTSPSLPFPKDCSLSLPGLPGQPPPPGVRGKSVCHCVCVTLWVFSEGGESVPTPFHWFCSTSHLPPHSIPRVPYGPQG